MRDLDGDGVASANGSVKSVRTTCPYCGVGCGVVMRDAGDGKLKAEGDRDHPANFGRLCSKGAALGDTLSLDDRLLAPLVDGRRASWAAALDLVAKRFSAAIEQFGPESVAIYGSGQLLTEDYYVANKLMKGFIGTANIDTNSRLCMASSVAGHKRAFGADTVPGTYEDLERADLVVLAGANLAWCHPVLFQRLAAAREARGGLPKIVVVDPRRTATCEIADMHLAIAPDSDVALFNGLFVHLVGANVADRAFVASHTSGFKAAFEAASHTSASAISRATGVKQPRLFEFYDQFARTERVVTVYSQGVNQSTSGTDKVNAIINCHLVTGRIGRPGMGPFSVTGQPNAMGGREVGGLSNMLAAHMELDNAAHRRIVQEFWGSPRIAEKPGLKAVDLFRAVADGRIKALWILATNPAVSMPDADSVRAALDQCSFVVVSDVMRHTDTTAHAHVLLPSLAWGEKSGTVTNSERRISRQRAFLAAPGEARADWWQIAEVARRMGWGDAFAYASPFQVFAEHARLSAMGNSGARDFDIGGLAELTDAAYDAMQPLQWPALSTESIGPRPDRRFFGDGVFFTPDKRARFVAVCTPAEVGPPQTGTFVLNTGRVRDQWHTMTRTGKAPRLMQHIAEPFLEIHPEDAKPLNLTHAAAAIVSNARGRAVLRVVVTERQRKGSVFAPMHWTAQLAPAGRIGALSDPAYDPHSGQPALKHARVNVERYDARSYAVAVSRRKPPCDVAAYCALSPVDGGWRIEAADAVEPSELAGRLIAAASASQHDSLSYVDTAGSRVRRAVFDEGRLEVAVFAAPEPVEVSRAWLSSLLAVPSTGADERLGVLAGRRGGTARDCGSIVCSCLGVGANDIVAAAQSGCTSVDAVGVATGAGTNCGSCRVEIGRLIDATRRKKAS